MNAYIRETYGPWAPHPTEKTSKQSTTHPFVMEKLPGHKVAFKGFVLKTESAGSSSRFQLKDSSTGDRPKKPWHDTWHVINVESATTFDEAHFLQMSHMTHENYFVGNTYLGNNPVPWEQALTLALAAYRNNPQVIHICLSVSLAAAR